MESSYFTIKEVTEYLKVKQSTIYNWLNAGKIPAHKLVGQWRFDKNEIDRWIQEEFAKPRPKRGRPRKIQPALAKLPIGELTREKRQNVRLRRVFPVKLAIDGDSTYEGLSRDVSQGGISLELLGERKNSELEALSRLDSLNLNLKLPHRQIITSGKVIWSQDTKPKPTLGLRFTWTEDEQKDLLGSFITREFSPTKVVTKPQVISELITYKNKDGKTIVGFYDHLRDDQGRPFIVIPPVYGETKTGSLSMAYYLVVNGFNVIRYDNTDHVGESEGEILNFTLVKAKEDLISTLDYLEKRFGIKEVGVSARCLANRVAMRAALEDERINLLISLVGIVNLQHTLYYVYKEDMIEAYLRGERWGSTDVLGHEVIFENFLEAALKENLHTLGGCLNDLRNLKIPYIYLYAEKDIWVERTEIDKLLNAHANGKTEFYIIPDAVHMLYENPQAAKFALRQVTKSALECLCDKKVALENILEPNVRQIAVQNRFEIDRLKTHELDKKEEQEFWGKYLTKYILIDKSDDYREYLDLIYNLLGEIKSDDLVLDAGCGPGYYGAWLLKKIIDVKKVQQPFIYVGIDFVENALKDGIIKHNATDSESESSIKGKIFNPVYILEDLSPKNNNGKRYKKNRIKLSNNAFDKICCSFVLPYVKEPFAILKELYRVLNVGGIAVFTSLKPHADLSQIYRNFVEKINVTDNRQEIIEARRLLSSAGKMKEKVLTGHYHFFSKDELISLTRKAAFKNVRFYRSFANQANVIVATK